ncbi:TRAP transporter small permease [Pelagibacterium luteolum]|uniref:TRAP transporter small permease protein n=1 Tax=Pelagibacterium luteolum TaxID=440168 RepID=A0A1G7SVM5_9HYPH|nr:TRAP transporter small permease [Pelagibacterium luteolum]SDG27021.1 TRAP-type C4-dicarboxylate transport system, small permease component [Pelagibacterium luteolum]
MTASSSHAAPAPVRFWAAFSNGLVFIELRAAAALLLALALIILTNVITRYVGTPIYLIDELAVFVMVWLAFIGTSAMSRLKLDFAVTFLADNAPVWMGPIIRSGSIVLIIAFGIALGWMSWIWADPIGIAAAGFDARAFAGTSFNFLYTEYTQTLQWPRWAVMMTIPLFAVCLVIHAIANLFEEIGLIERTVTSGFEEEAV